MPIPAPSPAPMVLGAMLVAAAMLLNAFIVKPLTAQEQQFAELGECLLESGEVIQDCRIGYRVVGGDEGGPL